MKNIIVVLFVLCSFNSVAQVTYQNNTIKVTGSALLEFEPDEIHLIVHLKEVKKRDKKITMPEARKQFYELCNGADVANADIKVSNMTFDLINRRLSFAGKKQLDIDQKEIYDIKFTDMNKLLALIKQLNQPYVEQLALGEITHSKIEQFREDVKVDATKAAFRKAGVLAKAVNTSIGKVIYINELSNFNKPMNNQYNLVNSKGNYRAGYQFNSFKCKVAGLKPLSLRYEVEMICELK